jgi:hypothetical protein
LSDPLPIQHDLAVDRQLLQRPARDLLELGTFEQHRGGEAIEIVLVGDIAADHDPQRLARLRVDERLVELDVIVLRRGGGHQPVLYEVLRHGDDVGQRRLRRRGRGDQRGNADEGGGKREPASHGAHKYGGDSGEPSKRANAVARIFCGAGYADRMPGLPGIRISKLPSASTLNGRRMGPRLRGDDLIESA